MGRGPWRPAPRFCLQGQRGEDMRTKDKTKAASRPAKWTEDDLRAFCRESLAESLGVPFVEIEAAAQEELRERDEETERCRQTQEAAAALKHALESVFALAQKHPHDGLGPIAAGLKSVSEATKEEIARLAWSPARERTRPLTRVVLALDRTNFLGLVERPANNQEFACLLLAIGEGPSLLPTQLESPMRIALKQVTDAVAKNRKENGRPAIIARIKQRLPPPRPGCRVIRRGYL